MVSGPSKPLAEPAASLAPSYPPPSHKTRDLKSNRKSQPFSKKSRSFSSKMSYEVTHKLPKNVAFLEHVLFVVIQRNSTIYEKVQTEKK